ncbi:hypothetical protein [Sphingomonas sp.]|uniref:hypothetical protein n=1 Tax=Sphingomonas sp. TaxID=28214 RepID=UPI0035C7C4AE
MSQYITLVGAEEVSRAASQMQSAASAMSGAASYFESVFAQHQRFMDDWLTRLDGTLSDRISDLGQTMGPIA